MHVGLCFQVYLTMQHLTRLLFAMHWQWIQVCPDGNEYVCLRLSRSPSSFALLYSHVLFFSFSEVVLTTILPSFHFLPTKQHIDWLMGPVTAPFITGGTKPYLPLILTPISHYGDKSFITEKVA